MTQITANRFSFLFRLLRENKNEKEQENAHICSTTVVEKIFRYSLMRKVFFVVVVASSVD